jgi:hypothetical protein
MLIKRIRLSILTIFKIMNIKKLAYITIFSLLLISSTHISTAPIKAANSYITEVNQDNNNQLLRVSLDSQDNNNVLIYLFTSKANTSVQDKYYGKKSYVIDLPDTVIATTNNINLHKVSDIIANVKIVPFLDTTNPLSPGMARIMIDSKIPDLTYKIIVKSIEVSNNKQEAGSAKIYYPPQAEVTEPQNMAFFTPLDKKSIPEIPQNPPSELSFDEDFTRTLAQGNPQDKTKLQVSPPADSIIPPLDNDMVQNLPEVGNVVPPGTDAEAPDQEGQSPQPRPQEASDSIKSSIPKNIASIIWPICLIVLFLMALTAFFILREMKKQNQKRVKNKIPTSPVVNIEEYNDIKEFSDFEEIEEVDIQAALKRREERAAGIEPFGDEIEEVVVVDTSELSPNKAVYLIEFTGTYSLIGTVDNEVTVLTTFHQGEIEIIDGKAPAIEVSKEGNVIGKEIYLVKIGNWQAIVMAENGSLSLHSNLSAP